MYYQKKRSVNKSENFLGKEYEEMFILEPIVSRLKVSTFLFEKLSIFSIESSSSFKNCITLLNKRAAPISMHIEKNILEVAFNLLSNKKPTPKEIRRNMVICGRKK
ncbi:MAG: hypothetical protein WKG06_06965 [Segetibacter sp.]